VRPLWVTDPRAARAKYLINSLSPAFQHAGDLDYRLVVVRDCCADPDAEVHAMLLDIVTAKQAAVVTTAELSGALPGRSS
jgi:nicotinamidase-related amidase